MLQITGEARFADVLELVLYNAALAGISLDGTRFFYVNTLRQLDGDAGRAPLVARCGSRSSVASAARPTSSGRSPRSASHAYGQAGDKVWVHLYGGNTLDTALADGSSCG